MIQKPSFASDNEVITKLVEGYGLPVDKLQFLPVGEDSWNYIAQEQERRWFIKLSRKGLYPSSVAIPAMLWQTFGYRFVLPPIPNQQGQLSDRLANHDLVVYPYLDGKTAMDCRLADGQWQSIGSMIATLHQTRLSDDSRQTLKTEDFVPPWAMGARNVIAYARTRGLTGIERELAAFVQSKEGEMRAIIARAEELGSILQKQQPELVLCHADPNQANIFITDEGRIVLIDWDGVMLAPRERDLTFFTGQEQEAFLYGYSTGKGDKPDPIAVAYYKYEWVVQEFHDDGTRIFFTDLDEFSKQHALQEFYKLFEPGDVVQVAYDADRYFR